MAVHVAVAPLALVTVPVKVVSAVRAREVTLPPATGVTAPTPPLTERLLALVVVHVSVVVPPEETLVGDAERVQVGGAAGGYVHEPSSTVALGL